MVPAAVSSSLREPAQTLRYPAAACFEFSGPNLLNLFTEEGQTKSSPQEKVDRRDVHPNPLGVSSGIVPSGPRVSHSEPSRSCLHLQLNLVRPLSLTVELRLCQNIEHYQLSI